MWYRLFLIHSSWSSLSLLAPIFLILNYWLLFFVMQLSSMHHSSVKMLAVWKELLILLLHWKRWPLIKNLLYLTCYTCDQSSLRRHVVLSSFWYHTNQIWLWQKQQGMISILKGLLGRKLSASSLCAALNSKPLPPPWRGVTDAARKANNLRLDGV